MGWAWRRWRARRDRAWIAAGGIWVLLNVAFFGSYFYLAARFYLPLCAFCAVAFAALVAAAAERDRQPRVRCAAAVLLLATVVAQFQFLRGLAYSKDELPEDARPAVAGWLALSPAERAAGVVPFDPVVAQAQGLLPPDVVAGITDWGALRRTREFQILRGSDALAGVRLAPRVP
jgi:hypothetical protein